MVRIAEWFDHTLGLMDRPSAPPPPTESLKQWTDTLDVLVTLAAPCFIAISVALKLTQLWAEIRQASKTP